MKILYSIGRRFISFLRLSVCFFINRNIFYLAVSIDLYVIHFSKFMTDESA
jgi:hypothetical protein